jgi:hypothetical protein
VIISRKGTNKESENSRKYAKLGSSKTKTIIGLAAVLFFVLYACSVGVSASTRTGSLSANNLNNIGAITTTKTITKTVHDTSTSTVTDTSTSTITSTTTSAVGPNLQSGSNVIDINGASSTQIFTNSADCQVTISLRTTNFVTDAGTLTLKYEDSSGTIYFQTLESGTDTDGVTAIVSGSTIFVDVGIGSVIATPIVDYSYIAICPS